MSEPTKADILKAAAIERMIADSLPQFTYNQKNTAELRADALERIAKDIDDE